MSVYFPIFLLAILFGPEVHIYLIKHVGLMNKRWTWGLGFLILCELYIVPFGPPFTNKTSHPALCLGNIGADAMLSKLQMILNDDGTHTPPLQVLERASQAKDPLYTLPLKWKLLPLSAIPRHLRVWLGQFQFGEDRPIIHIFHILISSYQGEDYWSEWISPTHSKILCSRARNEPWPNPNPSPKPGQLVGLRCSLT